VLLQGSEFARTLGFSTFFSIKNAQEQYCFLTLRVIVYFCNNAMVPVERVFRDGVSASKICLIRGHPVAAHRPP
jgi:hypothetical protein